MTVPTTAAYTGPYFPNGVTTEFPFGFKVNFTDEVAVFYLEDDGTETVVPSADYTVVLSTNENNPGGTVTTAAPLPDSGGKPLYIALDPEFTQGTKFEDEGAFNQSILNPTFDAGALRSIWLRSRIERAFIAPFGEVGLTMPRAAERANFFFSFDALGRPFLSPGTGADAGLRQALAQPNALNLLPAVDLALQGKAPVSTKSPAIGANLYPVDFRLGRDHPPHPFEFIPAIRHAAIINGTSTYDCADDIQAMLNGWTPANVGGGIIDIPKGVYCVSKPILLVNWVTLRGGGRGTQFFALAGHTGPNMFVGSSDPTKVLPTPSAMFNQRLESFDINANAQANIAYVIYAPSWNEKCGLRDIMARKVPAGFLDVDEWHGGSAGFPIRDLEVFFEASAYTGGKIGMRLRGINRAGGVILNRPQVTLENVTMAGATAGVDDANPGLAMIEVDNMHLQLRGGIHFERAQTGIYCSRSAMLTGFGVSGGDDAGKVARLIERGGNHTGAIRVYDCFPGTAAGAKSLKDNKTAINLTGSVSNGKVAVPSDPGEAWAEAYVTFAGTVPTVTHKQGPIAAVAYAGAAGYHSVTFSDSMANKDNYEVSVDVIDDTDCRGRVRPGEKAAGAFNFRMQRESDNTGFNAAAAWIRVFRRPGL